MEFHAVVKDDVNGWLAWVSHQTWSIYVEMWWNVLTFLPVSELYNDLVGHKINQVFFFQKKYVSQNTLW